MPKFHVHRSIQIDAPPEKVFEVISDFNTWTTWSPWLCAEPTARVTVTDDSASVGSVYAWEGEVTGAGELEHLKLEPGKLIEDEIRFLKPFKSKSGVSFQFEPSDNGTMLTWHMFGSMPWFLFWMVPQMEGFLGMDYERGLRMLKEWIETEKIETKTDVKGVEKVGPLKVLGIRKTCSFDDIGESMEHAFHEASEKLSKLELPLDGECISIYHGMDVKQRTFDYTSGYAVPGDTNVPEGQFSVWSIPELNALTVEHTGRYDHLGNAWSAAHQHVRYKKLKPNKCGGFEIYVDNPENTPAEELRTMVYVPLK